MIEAFGITLNEHRKSQSKLHLLEIDFFTGKFGKNLSDIKELVEITGEENLNANDFLKS